MSVRIQVILKETEAARFKSQAHKEGKSTSAWLRDAGRKAIERSQQGLSLKDPESLAAFFERRNEKERGQEPDWPEHKRLVLESMQASNKP